MDSQTIFIILVVLVVIGLVLYLATRSKGAEVKAEPPKSEERDAEPIAKGVERLEVDAPVKIDESMSLAEIKRAKAARIKGEKGRRETAVEATAAAREAAQADASEVSESVDDGWDDLLSEPELDDAPEPEPAKTEPAKVEPAKVEPAKVEPAKVQKPEPKLEEPSEVETPLAQGLERTRTGFIAKLGKLFRRQELDAGLVEDLEEVLYTADIGPRAAQAILGAVEAQLSKDDKANPEAVWQFVRTYVEDLLRSREAKLDIDAHKPFVILVIGVNGVGKTTTIGKMASKYHRAGKKVLLVAGDTFRAAAVEQIGVWGERADIPVHTGGEKADPASVVFSGVERGVKEGFDVVICDTAGRLHTNAPLRDELEKISRVTQKVLADAPHETILVLDANTGQNAIQQAKSFSEAVPITGIVLTKLDGTAKGGVILGICDELDAPIRYIGIGESVADLREFNAREFTDALFM